MRLVDPTSDMRKKLIRVLARNPLFGEMNPDQLSELSQQAEFCIHSAGELLVRQGEPSDNFFVLVRGHARVFLQSSTGDGENHLARLEAGAALGEMGLLLDEPRSASVRAEDQLLVARLTREIFERMIGELPAFGEAISRALARRLSTTLRKMPLPEAHQEELPEIEVIRLLPVPLLQRHRIMPLRTEGSVLVLGCVEDIDTSLIERLKSLTPGMEYQSVSIGRDYFERALRSLSSPELANQNASESPETSAEITGPLRSLMERAVAEGVSDLHLTAGLPPRWRLDGDIETLVDLPLVGSTDVLDWLRPAMRSEVRDEFENSGDADFAVALGNLARFRVNLFRDNHGVGAVLRQIPSTILSVAQLGLPPAILELASYPKGLVLVTGATGSGKSTTLAAMVDHINRNVKGHIITLEDPIEFVHESRASLVNQREIGVHTQGFHRALRAALRQDPDIVLVGELRDRETIELALEVANTGHLVFGTLHTATAMGTIDRIVDIFPAGQQAQIRTTLAEVLRGVVSQALCRKNGGGRVAAIEILRVNTAVANLIRKGNTAQIVSVMQTQRGAGNRLLNDALGELVKSGKVAYEEAESKALDKADLAKRCGR